MLNKSLSAYACVIVHKRLSCFFTTHQKLSVHTEFVICDLCREIIDFIIVKITLIDYFFRKLTFLYLELTFFSFFFFSSSSTKDHRHHVKWES